ncbi:MAG: MFS transporter [Phycisphaerales bacterium]
MPSLDAYAALRHADYRRFAGGWLLSCAGLQMLGTAVLWEVYERTGSAMALGYLGVARALPVILLALPAGHLIDLLDRRRVLAATQWAFAFIVMALAAASYLEWPVWSFHALMVLYGCARVFNGPARATLVPLLVPIEDFHNATTWNSGVFQFSATAGPLLAGAIIHLTGVAWPIYVLTGLGCAAFAVLAMTLHPRLSERPAGGDRGRVTAGLSHVWGEKTILAALTLDLFAVLLGGATTLLPIFAKEILHAGPVGLGVLRAAPYVGALLMAFWMAHRPPFRHAGRALLWSVALFGLSIIAFGLSTSLWLSVACLAFGGAVDNVSVVIRHVLVQMRTPEHIRGRVSSVNSVFIESSNELGGYESGLVASWFGPVASVVSGGVGTLVVVGLVAIGFPALRSLERLTPPPRDG